MPSLLYCIPAFILHTLERLHSQPVVLFHILSTVLAAVPQARLPGASDLERWTWHQPHSDGSQILYVQICLSQSSLRDEVYTQSEPTAKVIAAGQLMYDLRRADRGVLLLPGGTYQSDLRMRQRNWCSDFNSLAACGFGVTECI